MTVENEIKITLRDVYDRVENLEKVSGAIDAKLDLYIGLNQAKEDKLKDHESRLRIIERWVYALPGVAVILSIAGLVIAILKGP